MYLVPSTSIWIPKTKKSATERKWTTSFGMMEEEAPINPEMLIMSAAAVIAPMKTLILECFMARIVVTMNVRSPSSDARTARKAVRKPVMLIVRDVVER